MLSIKLLVTLIVYLSEASVSAVYVRYNVSGQWL